MNESAIRIRPVIIVEPGAMSQRDIKRMNGAGITVVEAKSPQNIRFLDPPRGDYTSQEIAAIRLCRTLLTNGQASSNYARYTISELYVSMLMEGGALKGVEPVKPVATLSK